MSRFYDLMIGSGRALAADAFSYPPRPAGQKTSPHSIQLDSNESPYGPSPRAVAAMHAVLEGSHTYPDDHATELRNRLAEKHRVQAEQILVSPGSTALLATIARTMLEPGLNAITSSRSFVVYRSATHAAGATLVETPTREGGFDLEAILDSIDEQTRVIFLANPNNPTGTFADAEQVDAFLARVPTHVVVVLDEAYYDYARSFAEARKVKHPASLEYVREARNVVVLRTFSKAHGLAGLRVGYGIGPAELMGYFANMQDAYAVSSVAQAAALAALDDEGHVHNAVQRNAEQAEWLSGELSQLGYRVLPTWANFLYCGIGGNAEELAARICAEGVSVRPLTAWRAPLALRITIGTTEQNHRLIAALRKVTPQA
jgi:histidinol-phosphate aminotransferase